MLMRLTPYETEQSSLFLTDSKKKTWYWPSNSGVLAKQVHTSFDCTAIALYYKLKYRKLKTFVSAL